MTSLTKPEYAKRLTQYVNEKLGVKQGFVSVNAIEKAGFTGQTLEGHGFLTTGEAGPGIDMDSIAGIVQKYDGP